MKRPVTVLISVLVLATGACANLGLGEAECVPPGQDVSSANVLSVQAVPTARYTPCLNGLPLGWDTVAWFAEDGQSGLEISVTFSPFLSAIVTESCDVSNAVAVESGYEDIDRYEDVEFLLGTVEIIIVPSGRSPLLEAHRIAQEFSDTVVEDRPVSFIIEDDLDEDVSTRVSQALSRSEYVWIIGELDAEEGTVELRGTSSTGIGHEQPAKALEIIEDGLPDVFYRGDWYFTFEGGCITYEFDADGTLAESVASDAEEALGFYPAFALRQFATDAGFDLG